MAMRGRTGSTLLVVLGLGLSAWWLWHRGDDRRSVKRLVNQVWIERMPRHQRDMIWGGVLVEDGKDRVGVISHGSQWRVHADLLLWRLDGDVLRTRFPQDDRRYDLKARTWECEGKAPEPFQLCLELKRGDRVLRFFSRKDWEIGSKDLPPGLAGFVPDRAGALRAAGSQQVGEGPESEGPGPFGD
jgi:hypothetical protein